MTKAVLFDFDGLLVDTEGLSLMMYQELLHEYGYDLSEAEYSADYSGKTEKGNVTHLIDACHLPLTFEQCWDRVMENEERLFAQGVDLKPGVRELLEYLKQNGYQTAVATSSTRDRAMNILKRHGIYQLFDEFVFSEDVRSSKPEPEVFLKACEKLNVLAGEALVLEDSENGILAAHNAGIPVICIPDMKRPSEDHLKKTAAVCNSLFEVMDYLEKQKN